MAAQVVTGKDGARYIVERVEIGGGKAEVDIVDYLAAHGLVSLGLYWQGDRLYMKTGRGNADYDSGPKGDATVQL